MSEILEFPQRAGGVSGKPPRSPAPVTSAHAELGRARVRRARATEWIARLVTGSATALVALIALGVVGYIVWKGAPAISWEFLSTGPGVGMRTGGILPAIVGTLWVVAATAVFAIPVGIAAGVYLAEYAPRGQGTRIIRLSIANMAGVPSIVYGLFGYSLFVIVLGFGRSILAGGLTLACLTLPVIITATEVALRQIPRDLRQASLALGATRWRTTWKVVLPAAAPGIVTGSILGLARAAGETAPIILTAAAFFQRHLPTSPLDKAMMLPYHLYVLATQVPNPPEDVVWGTALVLVGAVTAVSVTAAAWRSAQRRKIRW
jgi:phosphate transport system permease protein